MDGCAIDFGTSNSAVALPRGDAIELIALEDAHPTLPTAIFFNTDESTQAYGRAAIAAYIDGYDGRLMRSIKSILGSALIEHVTELGDGTAIRYGDVIATFLTHLKRKADAAAGRSLERAVLGRPVFFVDDDPVADAAAQASLAQAARQAGFAQVEFQFEPIAAAFDYEASLSEEQRVLVIDIGGGTSDFSLVRVGPRRARRIERKDDVLAHHGVHVAGTDFDRRVELAAILGELGYRATGVDGREIPSTVYFELATWHLINTLYTPKRMAEVAQTRHLYADPAHHLRLMRTLTERLGHALVGVAENAKIAVAAGGDTRLDLGCLERGLTSSFDETQLVDAVRGETQRIVDAAIHTARLAGLSPTEVDALYFTGGSTGLRFLSQSLTDAFPGATAVFGDRLASVARGLGIHAQRLFGANAAPASA